MRLTKTVSQKVKFLGVLAPLIGVMAHSQQVHAAPQSLIPERPSPEFGEGVRPSSEQTTLCEPILGTGKSVGIPIQVENEFGEALTDLAGISFELDNGSLTQDVTSLVTAPNDQLLVRSRGGSGNPNPLVQGVYEQPLQIGESPLVPLVIDNPGYFFLECTPDSANAQVMFPTGSILKAYRGNTLVSQASVAGRAATRATWDISFNRGDSGGITREITTLENEDPVLVNHYVDSLQQVGVPFRDVFAQLALIATLRGGASCADPLTYDADNGTYADYFLPIYWLVSVDNNNQWSWNSAGQRWIDELTGATSSSDTSSLPLMSRSSVEVAGGSTTVITADDFCAIMASDELLNVLAAQLLLIDGPMGNVPLSISDNVQSLRAAVLLEPLVQQVRPSPATTTTSTTTTTATVPSTTSLPQVVGSSLPKTGQGRSVGFFAVLFLAVGVATQRLRRRRALQ